MSTWAKVWTDGSCSQAGQATGPGGWAFVALEAGPSTTERSGGGYPATTNQRMELKAVYEALLWAATEARPDVLTIYSDSAYVINCFEQEWYTKWWATGWLNSVKQPVKNKGAWKRVLRTWRLCQYEGIEVRFVKVAGHSDDQMNCKADALASAARRGHEPN